MDYDSLLNASPLLTGKLLDRRQVAKREVIKFVLATESLPSPFSVGQLSDIVSSELGVNLDDSVIVDSLDYYSDEGYVNHISEREYEIAKRPDIDTFNELIEPVWEEFAEVLRSHDTDVDVRYINRQMEPAFLDFLNRFFAALAEASQELSEFQTDSFFDKNFNYLIDNVIDEHSLREPDIFKESLIDYLQDPGEEFLNFTGAIYTGIINLDLLSREGEEIVDLGDIDSENNILFLDTNILISLLCESDDTHPLIAIACERSKALGYELYYSPETAEEMDILIGGTLRELSGLKREGDNSELTESQFAEDYLNRDDITRSEYFSRLREWADILQLEHNVTEFEEDVERDDEIESFATRTLKELSPREPIRKIRHDAAIIAYSASLRDDDELNNGPFTLTRHGEVAKVNNIGRGEFWDEPVALHPRSWLNYLIAFTPAEISDEDRQDIAFALLRGAASSDDHLSIREYARLLVPKTGLEDGDEELLAEYLIEHPLSEELEKALEERRGDKAEDIVRESLDDRQFIEEFREERKMQQKLKNASSAVEERDSRIEELERKLQNQEEFNNYLRSLVDQNGDTVVNVTAEANSNSEASAEARARAEVVQEVDLFINLVESSLSEGIEESELPDPPEDTSNLEEVQSWLEYLNTAIATSDNVAAGVQVLQPKAQQLLEQVSSLV